MGKKKKIVELEQFILDFMRRHKKFDVPQEMLETAIIYDGGNAKAFHKALEKLISKGVMTRNNKNQLQLTSETVKQASNEGKISINRHGVGFVTLDGFEQDIRIPNKKLGLALTGDLVEIRITGKDNRGRQEGKILNVIKRGKPFYVGTFHQESKESLVIEPDEKSAHTPFFVHRDKTMGAGNHDKVIFKLLDWIHPRSLPEAEIIQVLGKKGSNDAELLSILAENEVLSTFSPEVEEYCNKIPFDPPAAEIKRRNDIRKKLVFTIDPDDAKDFDDALSVDIKENGNYYLGVHIADVTFYVRKSTVLDDSAMERATSVYLVDRVIPMLPETLSNGVCSLRPNEDKLTYSCFMEVTPNGKVVDYSIEETVIHSSFRLAYEEAEEIIQGRVQHQQLSEPLAHLKKLTDVLTENRFKENAIDINSPEPKFELDENGQISNIYIKKRLKAHRLIEECMLLANKTVAEHVYKLRKQAGKPKDKDSFPFFYRIHDKPNMERLNNVIQNVRIAGFQVDFKGESMSPKEINDILLMVRDKPIEYSVNDQVLRSMSKAEYSPDNIGHYGLGFKHYAHFTSPIRRYPDVIVHRMLKHYGAGIPSYQYAQLKDFGRHCSEKERMATTAERDSIKLKQVEFMSGKIGEEFSGVISGVTDKGMYILLNELFCEGMVQMRDLNDDYYIYDQQRHCLYGKNRGRTYKLGQELKVKVVNTNTELRQIDFELA